MKKIYKGNQTAKHESWNHFVAKVSNEDPFSIANKIGAEEVRNNSILTTLSKENSTPAPILRR